METETKTETSTEEVKTGEEGTGAETVSVPKAEYDKLNQTIGSMKRELKDLKKSTAGKESTETSKNQTEENVMLQKLERMSLRQAGITHQDDVELAKATAKKWGMDIDEVLLDDDFKVKLERLQTGRANADATSDIKGGQGTSQAKNTTAYWTAKGVPPTPADIPDRKVRATIIREMAKGASTNGKKFYND